MNKILPLSVFFIVATHFAPSMAAPVKNAPQSSEYKEDNPIDKTVNINLINQSPKRNIKTWHLQINDASRISLVLNKVQLPPGSWLEVSDENGEQRTIYNNKIFYDGTQPQLITTPVNGTHLVIRLTLPKTSSATGNVIIDHYSYVPVDKTRKIIGTNQMKLSGCYKTINPTFYAKSLAVFVANGGGTGWNVAGGPYAITNHHVAGDARPASLAMKYNYQYPGCQSTDPMEDTLTIRSESIPVAGTGGSDDWAVMKADPLAYQEAGIRQIFGTLVINSDSEKNSLIGTPLYVPQHPWASQKRITSLDDNNAPCAIISGGDSKSVHHDCDTDGGSSGSPLLSQLDNRVVGLHRAGGNGYNAAVLGPYVYQQIKQLIPDANQAAAATEGEGKLMVREINQAPYLPTDPFDLQVNGPVKITALYAGRLQDQDDYTLFSAQVRTTDGNIVPAKIRLQEITPCGTGNLSTAEQCTTSGARSLKTEILASDNPDLTISTGWMTLQISDSTTNQRLHNLVMPLSFSSYDPFTSPFADDSGVKNYILTEKSVLTTDKITMASNFGFVAVNDGQGPLTTMSGGTGYSKVKVPVKDEQGNVSVIHLRANRKTSCSPALRPMNSTTGCGDVKPAALVMSYLPEDNPQLAAGHYQGIFPVEAQRDDLQQPVLIHIDITR
ncbi:trypsin-like serine peptidase [Tatumella citrea]|uniref:Serine protease n=1 Tax=Tatumella citrea TaxID=53336 RepID=A0A1Y0LCQ0_TATCI|nr:serine protease [Tatumella citrea]ARU95851.1 hypothetical protein A7K98_20335 [Tatumella citrea]ARU99891.1 hypothetical protein A7K99_20320 [Tatumella citrea]